MGEDWFLSFLWGAGGVTDKINRVTVVLDKSYRTDDAEPILAALRQIRGVLSVKGNVDCGRDYMAEMRAREEWRKKFIDLLWPENENKRG